MINAQEKEVELVCCYSCNWDCDFCCVSTHLMPKILKDQLLAKLEFIKKHYQGWNVTLSGGEIGTMKKEDILFILDYLDNIGCEISLNTNGLFLDKYPELIPRLKYILYHCSQDLIMGPKEFIIPYGTIMEYLIVVSDNNIKNLTNFLHCYQATIFHLVAATQPLGGLPVILSNENRYKIMKKCYKNVTKESLKRLIIKEKAFDSIKYI